MNTNTAATQTVTAENAPIGVQLWPTLTPESAPNFTLDKVAVVRTENGAHVEWTYQSGNVRTFTVGEEVVVSIG